MDFSKLRRHESVREVADKVADFYSNVVGAVTEAVDEIVEQQDKDKQERVEETLGEKEKLSVQAGDINTLFGRMPTEEPIITLGELDAHTGTHVVAVISTPTSQVKSGHEGDSDLPYISFFKVDDAELAILQTNPFKRFHQEDGVVAVGEYLEGESVLGWASSVRMEEGIEDASPIPEQLLNALGALAARFEAGIARRGMHDFEESLTMIRAAMYNRKLNPELFRLLGEPISRS